MADQRAPGGSSNAGHQCSVLIVENEPELQDLLRVALESAGYPAAVASNGREALAHLRRTVDVCLILLDLYMPIMNGRDFRAAQLRDRSLAWIPVIVVSGGVDAAREAHALGAEGFVRKPIDVDELEAAIRRIECSRTQKTWNPERRLPGAPGRSATAGPDSTSCPE
jgi:CheY-like chemotaxis protein